METQVQGRLQSMILEFEKRYPNFKKMDIYSIVNGNYKKVHHFFKQDSEEELKEVKQLADQELQLSR
jgi:hypothetical protein